MAFWDSKCDWDIIWVGNTIKFQDIYRKMDGGQYQYLVL